MPPLKSASGICCPAPVPDHPATPNGLVAIRSSRRSGLEDFALEGQVGAPVDDQQRRLRARGGRIARVARLIVPSDDEALRPGDEGVVGRDVESPGDEADVLRRVVAGAPDMQALGDGAELAGRIKPLQVGRRIGIERRDGNGVRRRLSRTDRIGRRDDAIHRQRSVGVLQRVGRRSRAGDRRPAPLPLIGEGRDVAPDPRRAGQHLSDDRAAGWGH